MIEKHYAAHIKTLLDAGMINVRKPRKSKKAKTKAKHSDENEDL